MGALARLAASPWSWLALFLAGVVALLSLPVRLPIGPNYWDLAVYLDGAHRLALGQMPHRDFFAPVGGLSYLLFRALEVLWPNAHPLLIVQWSVLLVCLPPLALVVAEVGRASRPMALALLLPFLFFAAAPINGLELYPSPGFDAYGNYNRHICLILYVLAAALWWLPDSVRKLIGVIWLLLAAAGIKITGFGVGVGMILHAALAGRLAWRGLAIALAAAIAALALFDFATHAVRSYLIDIAKLVSANQGSLLGRFLTVASTEFDVLAAGTALAALLLWLARDELLAARPFVSTRFLRTLADSHAARFGATMLGGAVFETQNTGSQEFIFLWPLLLPLIVEWWAKPHRLRPLVLVLAVATILPHSMKMLHRTARALASAPAYQPLAAPELGPLGRVSAKPDILRRAKVLLEHYAQHKPAYAAFAARDELPSAILFSEIDYQLAWLMSVDQAIAALKAHETRTGRRYASLYTFDFVDVFSPLMDRGAPLHVPIGLDAFRTFPEPDAEILADLKKAEGILVPSCPITHARRIIAERFAPALEGRAEIQLTPCWTLRPRG